MTDALFNIAWDTKTFESINRLSASIPLWHQRVHIDLGNELAKQAIEYMKPLMTVRKDVPNTGALENSLASSLTDTATGYDITFEGLFYGLYIDNGNDALGEMTAPTPNVGAPFFPADARLGAEYMKPMRVIHPMGSYTQGVPNHYSEQTAQWLADGAATDLALKFVTDWLESAVGT